MKSINTLGLKHIHKLEINIRIKINNNLIVILILIIALQKNCYNKLNNFITMS